MILYFLKISHYLIFLKIFLKNIFLEINKLNFLSMEYLIEFLIWNIIFLKNKINNKINLKIKLLIRNKGCICSKLTNIFIFRFSVVKNSNHKISTNYNRLGNLNFNQIFFFFFRFSIFSLHSMLDIFIFINFIKFFLINLVNLNIRSHRLFIFRKLRNSSQKNVSNIFGNWHYFPI